AAQGAVGAARCDHAPRTLRKSPGFRGGEVDAQNIVGHVVGERLYSGGFPAFVGSTELMGFHDDPAGLRVPGEGQGADAELLLDGALQRGVLAFGSLMQGGWGPEPPAHLLQEFPNAFRQRSHLCFFQDDAGDTTAFHRLEKEGAFPGRTDGADDEPVRGVVLVQGHRRGLRGWVWVCAWWA